MLTNLPVLYDFYVGDPISRLIAAIVQLHRLIISSTGEDRRPVQFRHADEDQTLKH